MQGPISNKGVHDIGASPSISSRPDAGQGNGRVLQFPPESVVREAPQPVEAALRSGPQDAIAGRSSSPVVESVARQHAAQMAAEQPTLAIAAAEHPAVSAAETINASQTAAAQARAADPQLEYLTVDPELEANKLGSDDITVVNPDQAAKAKAVEARKQGLAKVARLSGVGQEAVTEMVGRLDEIFAPSLARAQSDTKNTAIMTIVMPLIMLPIMLVRKFLGKPASDLSRAGALKPELMAMRDALAQRLQKSDLEALTAELAKQGTGSKLVLETAEILNKVEKAKTADQLLAASAQEVFYARGKHERAAILERLPQASSASTQPAAVRSFIDDVATKALEHAFAAVDPEGVGYGNSIARKVVLVLAYTDPFARFVDWAKSLVGVDTQQKLKASLEKAGDQVISAVETAQNESRTAMRKSLEGSISGVIGGLQEARDGIFQGVGEAAKQIGGKVVKAGNKAEAKFKEAQANPGAIASFITDALTGRRAA